MNETAKTSIYLGVAAVVALVAVIVRPAPETFDLGERVGKPLFEHFTSPDDAASLEIVRYDEDLGELHTFRVARDRQSGHWTLPSHGNYPADAEHQMRDAATGLIDLQVLGIVSEVRADHRMLGVVEPDREQLQAGDEGVGLMVTFQDSEGSTLASLIVGNRVRDSEDQRYVRVPRQDAVYAVRINPERFSTTFEDWIQQDLLQLNPFDIEDVTIKDYSITQTLQGNVLQPRSDIKVRYDTEEGQWQLEDMVSYARGEATPVSLAEVELLDETALNDLKNAVGDLTIVDVRRKPQGLSADLRAGETLLADQEMRASLAGRGFYAAQINGEQEIVAANGEVIIGLNNGVEYLLRFGNVAGTDQTSEDGMNRYLLVTTRVNEDKFPEPELTPLPQLPGEQDRPEDGSENAEEESDEEAGASDDEPVDTTEIEAERERINRENQRKLDEHEERVEEARQRVRELNARFADWYYVISEDTFRQIHLSTNDIVTERDDAAETGFNIDAFRSLQEEGLEAPEEEETDDELEGQLPFDLDF